MDNLHRAMAADYGSLTFGPEVPSIQPETKPTKRQRKNKSASSRRKGSIYVDQKGVMRASITIKGKRTVKIVSSEAEGEKFIHDVMAGVYVDEQYHSSIRKQKANIKQGHLYYCRISIARGRLIFIRSCVELATLQRWERRMRKAYDMGVIESVGKEYRKIEKTKSKKD